MKLVLEKNSERVPYICNTRWAAFPCRRSKARIFKFVGCTIKRLMGGADLCRIAEHGFKSVTIREGYFIDIVVG